METSGSLIELERTVIRLGVFTVVLVLPANSQYVIIDLFCFNKTCKLKQPRRFRMWSCIIIQRFGRNVTKPLYDTLFPSNTLADYCGLTVEIPTVNGSLMGTAQNFLATHIIVIWRGILWSPINPCSEPYLPLAWTSLEKNGTCFSYHIIESNV